MFWVVDSLIMRKHKQKDSLDLSGSIETPQTVMTEESQVRAKNALCRYACDKPSLGLLLGFQIDLGNVPYPCDGAPDPPHSCATPRFLIP